MADYNEFTTFGESMPRSALSSLRQPHPLIPQLPITKDDQLIIRAWNSVAGLRLRARARVLGADGRILPFDLSLTPTANRVASDASAQLTEGWLLDVAVLPVAGSPRRGQCFVQVGLARGGLSFDDLAILLISDYAVNTAALGWPGGLLRSSLDGPGALRSITGTDPALGQEIVVIVPTNARWRLISIFAVLTTDATVATRIPVLVIDDGASTLLNVGVDATITASTTGIWQWVAGKARPAAPQALPTQELPLDLVLFQGWRIRTSTQNLQAGDKWAAPQLLVEEWIEP